MPDPQQTDSALKMTFEAWLAECRSILMWALDCDEAKAQRTIDGVGETIYRDKFDQCLTPQQCIDDELSTWNE